MAERHKYSPEQIAFLKKNVRGRPRRELTVMFNDRFGLNLSLECIVATCKRYKLSNGRDTRFLPGQTPPNKGRKCPGAGRETWFPKGFTPWNYYPVGSERINWEGYVDIKIAAPSKWRAKHLVVWESVNGPLPPGHAVIFADSNKRNFDLDNLLLLSRRELAVMNKCRLISTDAEITKTQLNIARIMIKCGDRKKS